MAAAAARPLWTAAAWRSIERIMMMMIEEGAPCWPECWSMQLLSTPPPPQLVAPPRRWRRRRRVRSFHNTRRALAPQAPPPPPAAGAAASIAITAAPHDPSFALSLIYTMRSSSRAYASVWLMSGIAGMSLLVSASLSLDLKRITPSATAHSRCGQRERRSRVS